MPLAQSSRCYWWAVWRNDGRPSTSGSFGAFAEHYVSPLAGFLVRYAYWAANVLVIGTEVTAIALVYAVLVSEHAGVVVDHFVF